jgi:hypothetical protein
MLLKRDYMNIHKHIGSLIAGCLPLLLAGLWFTGCKPEVIGKDLAAAPSGADVKFSVTPDPANPNIIHFKTLSAGVITSKWDLGNGANAQGIEVTGSYALQGDYKVKLTIFTAGGAAVDSQVVKIAQTNVSMLNREDYNFLTGGAANASGKTWVVDKDTLGHLGVGPSTSGGPDWYQAAANEKATEGFYDDEMVFNLNGFAYAYNNHGSTFANGSNAAGIGGPGGGGDITVNYTPPANLGWSITEEGTKKYLNITGNGFISYYTGVSKYEILGLSQNRMYLRMLDKANAGNAWYLRLVTKGFTRPVVAKPLKAVDLKDVFGVAATINWKADGLVLTRGYDSPNPTGSAPKVGLYSRQPGDANQYANLQVTLDYRFDLSTRNKFKVKVYAPGYNDYTNGKLLPQLSVKLQNSLDGGNAWQTQTEVIRQITPLDKWVELEFDFSGIAAVTKYDQVVLQFGGEGHPFAGVFFIDSFELK